MTISQMLQQSGFLTLLGMCVVFSFIVILIGCMNILRLVVHALKLDKGEVKASVKPARRAAVPAANSAADQKAIVAAIAAVLHEKENI